MSEDTIDFETVLDLCRDQHRRIVLAVLAREQRPLTVNDLTKSILKHNHQTAITEASCETLSEIQIMLFHAHLPRLDSAGVVEFDANRELVEPTEQFDQLQPALASIIEADATLDVPVSM